MKQKIYGLLSACFLMLGMLSMCAMTAYAEGELTGESGDCTYTLTPETGADGNVTYTLNISGDGNMDSYTLATDAPWYDKRTGITSVTIEDGVTRIGKNAFCDCTNLIEVSIPDSVTSIELKAFYNCKNLSEVTIPNGVTIIENDTFYNCTKLTEVTIPDGVTSIGERAFRNCDGLPTVNISENSKLETIGAKAFDDCGGLTEVTIPDSVTSIGNEAFLWCDGLTTVNISENSKLVTIGEAAFNNCSKLTEVTIPAGVTSIGVQAFRCCKMTEVTIPDSVTSIGEYAFYFCTALANLTIKNGDITIASNAFLDCTALTNVNVPCSWDGTKYAFDEEDLNYTPHNYNDYQCSCGAIYGTGDCGGNNSSVTWTLEGTNGNCTLTIDGIGAMKDYGSSKGTPWYNFRESITKLEIGEGITSIGNNAFSDCSGLTEVTIPEAVTSIGYYAFEECSNLTSVTLPASVESIGQCVFWGCTSLKEATIPEGVTTLNGTFYNCTNLSSVKIPDTVTSIENGAFGNCSSLTEVTIPASVTTIGENAFYWCSGLTSVTIPEKVTSIGETAFYNCSGLTSVTIPAAVTSIESKAFSGCTKLTEVTIPAAVTSIGEKAFYYCTALANLTIENGDITVGSGAFDKCSRLANVNVPCSWDSQYSFADGVVNEAAHTPDDKNEKCTVCGDYLNGWGAVMGHSLTLTDSIGLNFVLDLNEDVQNTNTKVVFTMPSGDAENEETTVEAVWSADNIKKVDDKTYYVFTCPVAAKQMSDSITVKVVVGEEEQNETNDAIADYSVRAYAEEVLGDANQAAAHDTVKAMLNYGACAQQYFDYETENLANTILDAADKNIATLFDASNWASEASGFMPKASSEGELNEMLKYIGSTIILESEVIVRHYYRTADAEVAEAIGTLTKYDDGEENNYYYTDSESINVLDMDEMETYTCTYTDAEEQTVTVTVNYSPLSYALTVLHNKENRFGENEVLQDVLKAMYLYHSQAEAYYDGLIQS